MINPEFIKQLTPLTSICLINEPMSAHTSFKLGGQADYFVGTESAGSLKKILKLAKEYGVEAYVLGNGSNVLVSDDGIPGLVVSIPDCFADIRVDGDRISCGAGVPLKKLCMTALDGSLAGLEFAYGIPGSVGGAVYMDAGAYGGEIRDVLESVSYITKEGGEGVLDGADCDLGYRHSVFKDNKDLIITGAVFRLVPGDQADIRSKMDELMERRRSKQPLEYPSAGSTFKRPEGNFAGALIERTGLKGYTVGGASVSEKHAGFVINSDRDICTAKDVKRLINNVRGAVFARTGILLEPEVEFLP